jgi:hypothetical protein
VHVTTTVKFATVNIAIGAKKKREPIDDMVDTRIWMRRQACVDDEWPPEQ